MSAYHNAGNRPKHSPILRPRKNGGTGGKDAKDKSASLALAVRRGRPPAHLCLLSVRTESRSPQGETLPQEKDFVLLHTPPPAAAQPPPPSRGRLGCGPKKWGRENTFPKAKPLDNTPKDAVLEIVKGDSPCPPSVRLAADSSPARGEPRAPPWPILKIFYWKFETSHAIMRVRILSSRFIRHRCKSGSL